MPVFKVISVSPDDKVAIWRIEESEDELRSMAIRSGLDLSILDSFSHAGRRKEWLASRLAARNIDTEIDLPATSGQRPHSQTHSISFSHSGDFAVAEAKKSGPAGVDIQEINDKVIRIQRRFLHSSEEAALDNPEKLALIWAGKEAIYKIYSDPYITFREDLAIELPCLALGTGSMRATIDRKEGAIDHELYFELFENYALVCVKS